MYFGKEIFSQPGGRKNLEFVKSLTSLVFKETICLICSGILVYRWGLDFNAGEKMENSFTEACEPYYIVWAWPTMSVKLLPLFLVFWRNQDLALKVHPPFMVHEIAFN